VQPLLVSEIFKRRQTLSSQHEVTNVDCCFVDNETRKETLRAVSSSSRSWLMYSNDCNCAVCVSIHAASTHSRSARLRRDLSSAHWISPISSRMSVSKVLGRLDTSARLLHPLWGWTLTLPTCTCIISTDTLALRRVVFLPLHFNLHHHRLHYFIYTVYVSLRVSVYSEPICMAKLGARCHLGSEIVLGKSRSSSRSERRRR